VENSKKYLGEIISLFIIICAVIVLSISAKKHRDSPINANVSNNTSKISIQATFLPTELKLHEWQSLPLVIRLEELGDSKVKSLIVRMPKTFSEFNFGNAKSLEEFKSMVVQLSDSNTCKPKSVMTYVESESAYDLEIKCHSCNFNSVGKNVA